MLVNLLLLIGFLILLILAISYWRIHPFIALLLIALGLGTSVGLGGVNTVEALLQGFSETLKWIAIIIILGAFIGEVLQETGGALRISDKVVALAGEKRLPWAMGFTGYLVSIPVFVDVAYILLQPVTESLAVKSKRPVLYIGLALTAGLTVSHTLIPPTPGPMAVATLLEVDLGRMLLMNLFVALCAMIGGIFWVKIVVKNVWLDYDDKLSKQALARKEKMGVQASSPKIPFLIDLLPILVPLLLIAVGALYKGSESRVLSKVIGFISIPLVAVCLGGLISIFQIQRKGRLRKINSLLEQAILKSALVIMITGAGGALGHVIRETGIQDQIAQNFSTFPFLGLLLPFLLASVLTLATGSITVSLVGSASILGPMMDSHTYSPEITAALIGCGSFCVFHANSSFFWLLNRLHEAPPNILYKTFTLQSLCMGLSGLIAVGVLIAFGY